MRDREESESGGIAIDFALHTSLVTVYEYFLVTGRLVAHSMMVSSKEGIGMDCWLVKCTERIHIKDQSSSHPLPPSLPPRCIVHWLPNIH